MNDRTTINIRKETRDRVEKLGRKGETWDALLLRLARAYQDNREM